MHKLAVVECKEVNNKTVVGEKIVVPPGGHFLRASHCPGYRLGAHIGKQIFDDFEQASFFTQSNNNTTVSISCHPVRPILPYAPSKPSLFAYRIEPLVMGSIPQSIIMPMVLSLIVLLVWFFVIRPVQINIINTLIRHKHHRHSMDDGSTNLLSSGFKTTPPPEKAD